jgi:hypothetical protein
MPLLEFLYSDAKYSQSSLSPCETQSPGWMLANFCVRYLSVAAWNLFWCDCSSLAQGQPRPRATAYFQVAQLSELLSTIIKLAGERLDLLVNNLMSTHIATLRKGLTTDVATIRALACVSSLMCLQRSAAVVRCKGTLSP